jgi:hypothetical protein
MDGSLFVAFTTTTTLWHFDALEQGPSTSSLRAAGEAIQSRDGILDCFVASLLAMTCPSEWISF